MPGRDMILDHIRNRPVLNVIHRLVSHLERHQEPLR